MYQVYRITDITKAKLKSQLQNTCSGFFLFFNFFYFKFFCFPKKQDDNKKDSPLETSPSQNYQLILHPCGELRCKQGGYTQATKFWSRVKTSSDIGFLTFYFCMFHSVGIEGKTLPLSLRLPSLRFEFSRDSAHNYCLLIKSCNSPCI